MVDLIMIQFKRILWYNGRIALSKFGVELVRRLWFTSCYLFLFILTILIDMSSSCGLLLYLVNDNYGVDIDDVIVTCRHSILHLYCDLYFLEKWFKKIEWNVRTTKWQVWVHVGELEDKFVLSRKFRDQPVVFRSLGIKL